MEKRLQFNLSDPELAEFLLSAPKTFGENEKIKKFQLKNGNSIHCVFWNYHYFISGTDIVKIQSYLYFSESRYIMSNKKFEEGIFSDLRNLKPGVDAVLEEPRSKFLEFLYNNGCIRTKKKQKVFYWYSVPHEILYKDAVDRDHRRKSQNNLFYYQNDNMINNGSTNNHNNVIDMKRQSKKNYQMHSSNAPTSFKFNQKNSLKHTLFGNLEDDSQIITNQHNYNSLYENKNEYSRRHNEDRDELSNIIRNTGSQSHKYNNSFEPFTAPAPYLNFQQSNLFNDFGADFNINLTSSSNNPGFPQNSSDAIDYLNSTAKKPSNNSNQKNSSILEKKLFSNNNGSVYTNVPYIGNSRCGAISDDQESD